MLMSTCVYKTVDGHAISADVSRSADDVVRPTLVYIHGGALVPYEQSVLMARRLGEAGVEHELLTIEGGGHGFDRAVERRDVARALDRALAFLVEHCGL